MSRDITLAEAEGFEPPVVLTTLAFKASAFGRSATLPSQILVEGRRPSLFGGVVADRGVDLRKHIADYVQLLRVE